MVIIAPATIKTVTRLKDKGVNLKITMETNITPERLAYLDQVANQLGWLAFSPNKIQPDDLPITDAPMLVRSPSQRLRYALQQRHEAMNTGISFDQYYKEVMEKVIAQVTSKQL